MNAHLHPVTSVSFYFPKFVHQVQPCAFGRNIHYPVTDIGPILDELVRTVRINERIALFLVFAEIVLT